jgi:hypothetical protein
MVSGKRVTSFFLGRKIRSALYAQVSIEGCRLTGSLPLSCPLVYATSPSPHYSVENGTEDAGNFAEKQALHDRLDFERIQTHNCGRLAGLQGTARISVFAGEPRAFQYDHFRVPLIAPPDCSVQGVYSGEAGPHVTRLGCGGWSSPLQSSRRGRGSRTRAVSVCEPETHERSARIAVEIEPAWPAGCNLKLKFFSHWLFLCYLSVACASSFASDGRV